MRALVIAARNDGSRGCFAGCRRGSAARGCGQQVTRLDHVARAGILSREGLQQRREQRRQRARAALAIERAAQGGGAAQLEQPRALAARDGERVVEAALGVAAAALTGKDLPFAAQQLGQVDALAVPRRDGDRVVERGTRVVEPPGGGQALGAQRDPERLVGQRAGSDVVADAALDLLEPGLDLAVLDALRADDRLGVRQPFQRGARAQGPKKLSPAATRSSRRRSLQGRKTPHADGPPPQSRGRCKFGRTRPISASSAAAPARAQRGTPSRRSSAAPA